eukprot:6552133-Prymnesium_polylepis.1
MVVEFGCCGWRSPGAECLRHEPLRTEGNLRSARARHGRSCGPPHGRRQPVRVPPSLAPRLSLRCSRTGRGLLPLDLCRLLFRSERGQPGSGRRIGRVVERHVCGLESVTTASLEAGGREGRQRSPGTRKRFEEP